MNPVYFVMGYVVLTFLFWLGNRNVKVKKPRNSAVKWLLWTTTWISFSLIVIDLPAGERTPEGVFGPALISPFVYPMLFTRGLPIATVIVISIAPVLAAWLGYVLARRHNAERVDPNARPVVAPKRVDHSEVGA